MELLGIPYQAWLGQIVLGLINGAFYAILSLGLSLIFGLLHVVNFAHGAMFMLGALGTWMALQGLGLGYGPSLLLVPLAAGLLGVLLERGLIRRIRGMDPLYGLLLTFGLALIIEGSFVAVFGVSGQPYPTPSAFAGATDLGFMRVPNYRIWVVGAALAACLATWLVVEKTRIGSLLRAATENPGLVQAFGANVPLLMSLTYGAGVALAAFAGVLAAPVTQVSPLMGSNLVIVVFAVVVIGGMGSIAGSVLTGLGLGLAEGIVKVIYPQASNMVIFVVMVAVLLLRPAGLFGKEGR